MVLWRLRLATLQVPHHGRPSPTAPHDRDARGRQVRSARLSATDAHCSPSSSRLDEQPSRPDDAPWARPLRRPTAVRRRRYSRRSARLLTTATLYRALRETPSREARRLVLHMANSYPRRASLVRNAPNRDRRYGVTCTFSAVLVAAAPATSRCALATSTTMPRTLDGTATFVHKLRVSTHHSPTVLSWLTRIY
jgi:hypothetical protein